MMKKKNWKSVFFAVAALSLSLPAQALEPDTVIVVDNPKSVVVTDNGSVTMVEIQGSKNDPELNYRYTVEPDSVSAHEIPVNIPFLIKPAAGNKVTGEVSALRGLYGGAVFRTSGPSVMGTSWEAGMNHVIGYGYRRRRAEFSVGVGFGIKTLMVGDGHIAVKEGDCLGLVPAPEGACSVESRVNSWAIHVPVAYTQRFYKSWGFQLAVVANFNFYTTASMSYKLGDITYSRKINGLHQRLLTPDVMLTIGSAGNLGVYVRWSPVKMFERRFGPVTNTISCGLSVGF